MVVFPNTHPPFILQGPTAEMDDDLNYFSFTLKCSLAANTSNVVSTDTNTK